MRQTSEKNPNYAAPALDKGLDILELLALGRRQLTQTEIARQLGRGQSEIFRMLGVLERRGFLAKDADGTYGLTMRLYELAHSHSPFEDLVRVAQKPMRQLSDATGESCHLSILSGPNLLVLAQQESRAPVRLSIETGTTLPALQTTSGRLLLAFARDAERAQFERENGPLGEDMHAQLAQIRARGYESAPSAQTRGVWNTAVLVGSERAGIRAALGIAALSSPGENHDLPELVAPLQQCAQAIREAARWVEEQPK